MKLQICVALSILASSLSLAAQLEDADPATQNKCAEYLKTPLPPEAEQAQQPKSWPECNSYKRYSGIGVTVEFAAARRCAWQERLAQLAGLAPRYTSASVFCGSAMLTVLYTNGDGVQKNLPLALRFACEAAGAPAEISIRIEDIGSRFQKPGLAKKKFTFCDDITSGFMEGFCAAESSELEDLERSLALNALASKMTPVQRDSFNKLVKLEQAYASAHGAGEIDISGSARAMFEIDAEDTLRDDFAAAVQSFEAGGLPAKSRRAYRDADARLNSVYRKAIDQAEEHKNDYGAVQPEGIRNAERAWLKYRDAWAEFARLRYPGVASDDLLVLLTNDRTSILDGSFCDMDAMDGPCVKKGDMWKPTPLP